MNLIDFNKDNQQRIVRSSTLLREQHNVQVCVSEFTRTRLEKMVKLCETNLARLRLTSAKFHAHPEYTKYINLRELATAALNEGIYAESPNFKLLRQMVRDVVEELMNRGYDDMETERECMNRYREDNRFVFDDQFVQPLVREAINTYVDECNAASMVEDIMDYEADQHQHRIEDLDMTLEGKIQRALAEGKVKTARKYIKQLKEKKAKPDYLDMDRDGNKKETMKKAIKDKKKGARESVFNDLISELLSEGVDLDQAEVVMATQGMGNDIQDVNEKIGRMMNEDLVAIADQVRNEQGAQAAQQFLDSMTAALQAYMDAGKQAKASIDQVVSGLTGNPDDISLEPEDDDLDTDLDDADLDDADLSGLDDLDQDADDDMDLEDEIASNDQVSAGPRDEPLGRAEL